MTDTTTTNPTLAVHIHHDYDADNPNEVDGLFKLVSFSTRHVDFMDPDELFTCESCGEDAQSWIHKGQDAKAFLDAEWGDRWDETDFDLEDVHDFIPGYTVASMLNYYEHGLCRWYVSPNASPVDMQWDGAYNAGALIVEDPEFWATLSDEAKQEQMEGFVEVYTDWANGNVYGYSIERLESDCECCGQSREGETVDSCYGFYGDDIVRGVKEAIAYELGIEEDEVEMGVHFVAGNDEYDVLTYGF